MIRDGETGLLTDFFDAEAMAARVLQVLEDPPAFAIRRAAVELIRNRYARNVTLPQIAAFLETAAGQVGTVAK